MTSAARPSGAGEALLAALFFVGATLGMTWPQAAHLGDGLNDAWDAKQNAWILHWDFIQTLRAPTRLFDAPILHPAREALAFSENLWGISILGFPLLAAGVPIVASYNAVFLLAMALSGWAAWRLAREVTGDAAASLLAGIVFAFVPWRIAQLPHVNMQWGAFLCLLCLFLLRYLDSGRPADLLLFAACFAANLLGTLQYGLVSLFAVGIVWAFEGIRGGRATAPRIAASAAALAGVIVLCAPLLLPYRRAAARYGMVRGMDETRLYSGRPTDFLSAGARNRTYGGITLRWSRPEGDLFPGLLPLVLAAGCVLELRRRSTAVERATPPPHGRRTAARIVDVAVLLATVLALLGGVPGGPRGGPFAHPSRLAVVVTVLIVVRLTLAFPSASRFRDLHDFLRRQRLDRRAALLLCLGAVGVILALGVHTPYYRLLYMDLAGAFRAVRVPTRAIVLFHLALGVLAAWGLSLWTRGLAPRARAGCVAAALGFVILEYRAFPLDLVAYDSRLRPVDAWLRSSGARAVLEWPAGFPYDPEWMLRQADHGRPVLNGHQSFLPPDYEELIRAEHRSPIPPSAWERIAALGADVLVLHPRLGTPEERERNARFLREGVSAGKARPVAAFGGEDPVEVFRLSDGTPAGAHGR